MTLNTGTTLSKGNTGGKVTRLVRMGTMRNSLHFNTAKDEENRITGSNKTGLMKGLSRVMGNYHARFLGGLIWAAMRLQEHVHNPVYNFPQTQKKG